MAKTANLWQILSETPPLIGIYSDENEQHRRESKQGRSSVTDEREGDADDRHKPESHSYIYKKMHKDAACRTIAVDSGERLPALLGIVYYPPDQEYEQQDQNHGTYKAPFLADGAENEVRALLWHESEGCLGAVQESLSDQSAGADGYK